MMTGKAGERLLRRACLVAEYNAPLQQRQALRVVPNGALVERFVHCCKFVARHACSRQKYSCKTSPQTQRSLSGTRRDLFCTMPKNERAGSQE